MSKILFDEKLEAVLRAVNGGMSANASSRMLGADSSNGSTYIRSKDHKEFKCFATDYKKTSQRLN